jgi:hypothetical protein
MWNQAFIPHDPKIIADTLEEWVTNKKKAVLAKFWKMETEHSSEWFKLSSNKEADERGSRASVSVQGLRLPNTPTASKELADMVEIARHYYHDLHTPIKADVGWDIAQSELMDEIEANYRDLPPP